VLAADPLLLADTGAGPIAALARLPAGTPPWQTAPAAATLTAACAAAPAVPRLAMLSRPAGRIALERCRDTSGGRVEALTFGRLAIALVTPAGGSVFLPTEAVLFRAFGAAASGRAGAQWSDLQPGLPAAPASLLTPPSGSPAAALFATSVMEPGCNAVLGIQAPFALADRLALCGALRTAPGIAARPAGEGALAAWLGRAPAGALAVVTLAELRGLQGEALPLPLQGLLPTVGNVLSGAYPATQEIQLLIVLPRRMPAEVRLAAQAVAFDLLSERSLGPAGTLPPAGLVALPAEARVALRDRALALLEP
jgi:phosphate transport system substrate-binding protein